MLFLPLSPALLLNIEVVRTAGGSTRRPSVKSPTRQLHKWKRNQIFEAIQAAELDPREFELKDDNTDARIKHKWSESFFIICDAPGGYTGQYIVGDRAAWSFEVSSWQVIVPRINQWLNDVKLDLETPDLWSALQQEAELLGVGSDETSDNSPFTPDEKKIISRRLEEFAEHVKRTHTLSEAQTRALEAKLDHLVKATSCLGKTDWRNAFVGVMLGFILTVALPPEFAREMLLGLFRVIEHFYGLPGPPSG